VLILYSSTVPANNGDQDVTSESLVGSIAEDGFGRLQVWCRLFFVSRETALLANRLPTCDGRARGNTTAEN
jgi:hypothetical protein